MFAAGSPVFTAQLGGQGQVPGLESSVYSAWAAPGADGSFTDSPFAYNLAWHVKGRFVTGFRRDVKAAQLATLRSDNVAAGAWVGGARRSFAVVPGALTSIVGLRLEFRLPFRRIEFFNTDSNIRWGQEFVETDLTGEAFFFAGVWLSKPAVRYRPGKSYTDRWNAGPLSPGFTVGYEEFPDTVPPGVARSGDQITANLKLYGDSVGHPGFSSGDEGTITLFADGKKVAETPYSFAAEFPVLAARARYRLVSVAHRPPPLTLSTRLSTAWTFYSAHVDGDQPALMPLSVVRFTPKLDRSNTAPAGRKFTVPVAVQRLPGSPAAANKKLTVDVSYDGGRTWQRATLTRSSAGGWTAKLQHPNRDGFVSLRAAATDKAGNTVEQTIIHAYRIAPAR